MNTQNFNVNQVQTSLREEDMIDQSFVQINQEISKALLEMKEDEKVSFKNRCDMNENILANKSEIKNEDSNQNNTIFPNLFNNFNDYESNNNYHYGNNFPKNQFFGYNNNININDNINKINNNLK